MSQKGTADYLRDLLQELDDIATFTIEGKSTLSHDVKTRKAVIRSYEVIGEIAKRLPNEFRIANPQIAWHLLIGFRDFLAHHYEEIILENIWQAVEDLPNLQAKVKVLLSMIEAPDEGSH